MIVYGASGHGKVIVDILESSGMKEIEIWDDAEKPPVWKYRVKKPPVLSGANLQMVLAIGNNKTRKTLAEKWGIHVKFYTAKHPSSAVSKYAHLGIGTVIMAGVSINADVRIGSHCILNTNASVDHDCILGDFVHISPNATLSGDVFVGEGTHVGAGAVVIQGITIGRWATIGAGAVIIKNVPDYATVVGNPGKIVRIIDN